MTNIPSYAASKFELHYFFSDSSHTMDAFVKNKCESEFLQIINEISHLLDVKLQIESIAYNEGGFVEFWKLLGKNNNQISIVLVITTLFLSRIPMQNKELENLQIEESRLSIEEKKLNIEKLKRELKSNAKVEDHNLIDGAVDDINTQLKTLKHRSNFYAQLIEYKKVTKFSANSFDENNEKIDDGAVVEREYFSKFILKTDLLPSEFDESAAIEIISPVLKKGNFKWKGIYNDEVITFYMKDHEFKDSIIAEGIPFKNGTSIECILEKTRKINDLGVVEVYGYSVVTVVRKIDDLEIIETNQGKIYLKNKRKSAQLV